MAKKTAPNTGAIKKADQSNVIDPLYVLSTIGGGLELEGRENLL